MVLLNGERRPESAYDRMTRVLAMSMGTAGALFLLVDVGAVAHQVALVPTWWNLIAFTLVAVPAAALMVGAFLAPVRRLRQLATCFAVVYLPVTASVPLVYEWWALRPQEWPWITVLNAISILCVAIVWPLRVVVLYIVVVTPLNWLALWWTIAGSDPAWVARHALGCALFGLLFAALAARAYRSARTLDSETEQLREDIAARAAARALADERARVNALVHDTVLSTLASASNPSSPELGRKVAAESLRMLDALAVPRSNEGAITVREFAARIRQVCSDISDDVAFRAELAEVDADTATVDVELARVFQEVLGEGLRNSVRHAGTCHRSMTLQVDPARTSLVLQDDGSGFNPAKVPNHRLGIAVAMRGRMAGLDGGSLTIDSHPGQGTLVELAWQRP